MSSGWAKSASADGGSRRAPLPVVVPVVVPVD